MDVRVGGEASALVGGTPLVKLGRVADDVAGEVVAKLEYFNPGGSTPAAPSRTGSAWP